LPIIFTLVVIYNWNNFRVILAVHKSIGPRTNTLAYNPKIFLTLAKNYSTDLREYFVMSNVFIHIDVPIYQVLLLCVSLTLSVAILRTIKLIVIIFNLLSLMPLSWLSLPAPQKAFRTSSKVTSHGLYSQPFIFFVTYDCSE
jgi:hypothetical protein